MIVRHYENVIEKALLNGEEINIHGFIRFKVGELGERAYKDAVTGEMKLAAPIKRVRIKASERLDRMVNER